MFIVFDLSPEAMPSAVREATIATLNQLANEEGVTRSKLIEHHLKSIEPLLNAAELVLLDATSDDYCLSPHPSYSVSGELISQLSSAYNSFQPLSHDSQ